MPITLSTPPAPHAFSMAPGRLPPGAAPHVPPGWPMRPPLCDVRPQLLAECDAMLRYAFAGGLQVPAGAVETAAQIEGMLSPAGPAPAGGSPPAPAIPLPVLAQLHGQLSRLVAPATPRTIRLLDTDRSRDGLLSIMGPLPNVRRLMGAAAVCTAAFVFTSLSPLIDSRAMAADIYAMSGLPLLVALCFLLSAAGMGSTFHALFTAQGFVAEGTYDPRHDASYWIRVGLGIVAGLLMAVLIPVDAGTQSATMTKPLLALLGGFSAGLVYNVLRRLVDTVESLFKGDQKDLHKRQEDLQRTASQHASMQARVDVAEQLIGLRDELAKGTPPGQINERLSAMLDGLLNRRTPRPAPAAAAAPMAPAAATGAPATAAGPDAPGPAAPAANA
jgi:hypothetical protein